MNKNFLKVTNKVEEKTIDIYVYGDIVGGSEKWYESDVVFNDFKVALADAKDDDIVNIYVNSGGGSVFATQGMIAILKRAKAKGIKINAYLDGLCASCASFLPMVADNIYTYNSSILMIHKPMTIAVGNSDDMKEQIDILDKIEDSVMLPLYMDKAKEGVTEEKIKDMLKNETWLNAKEMTEMFNIELLEDKKELVAYADKEILDNYKNTPQAIKDLVKENEARAEPEIEVKIDDTALKLAQAKLELEAL